MTRWWSRWWSHPFWQTPEQEDQELLQKAGPLFVTCLCGMLLATGHPLLALCGTGVLLFQSWRLLDDEVGPSRVYGVRRFAGALLENTLSLWFLLLGGLLLLPALLLATAFPGLLWFAGALVWAGSLIGGLSRLLRPLGGAHLSAAGIGIALAFLLRSPLVLAGSAVFLAIVAGAWTRLSRADLRAFVPCLRRQLPSGLADLKVPPPDAASRPEGVAARAEQPLPEDAFTFPLSAWVACHLDGLTAEDPERLRQELSRPVPRSRLPLCRRILAHAIQFQEGPFVRELVQNVLDEARRIGAGPWRRILEIDCRAAGPQLLEIEVADLLGMSFATVVNDLLVPNRTSKSVRDWGTIGRFGQGFFTTLREAESVRVRSFQCRPAGGGWDLDLLLTPVWRAGSLCDVTVSLATVWRRGPACQDGTIITWRCRRDGDDFVKDARDGVREICQNVPVEELDIRLDGDRANQPSSNYARIPTLLGPLRLSVDNTERRELLLTKNHLPLAQVSRPGGKELFPEVPERWTEILFAGGVVLDLPAGLPLNRSRNALAGRETFDDSLSRDVARACLLTEIELALRLHAWPATLRRDVIPRKPADWSGGSQKARELGERIGTGEATLEDLCGFAGFDPFGTGRSELLLALPCIPDRWSGARRSLSQLAGASWGALLSSALPWPSRPVHHAFFSADRRSLVGRLTRMARWLYGHLCVATLLTVLLLLLAIPLWFLGEQVGLWAFGAFLLYLLLRLATDVAHRTLLAIAAPIGEIPPGRSRCSVWDALGSVTQDGAALLLQKLPRIQRLHPRCRLYQKASRINALAEQGGGLTGKISWNAHAMTKGWNIRHLLRYLRSKGDPGAAETLRPWLARFLFLLTHESVHLLERSESPTHEEAFFRRQRRLLEKALVREGDFMALFEREARRAVRWTWSPAWLFLMWRSAKRRQWEWVGKG